MNQPSQAGPSPALFFETINAYQKTAALRTSLELDLFRIIADGASTAGAIAAKCAASERGIRILCDSLLVWGFLTREGTGYGLTQDSAVFLNSKSPAYVGGTRVFLLAPELTGGFDVLTEAVRQGGTAMSQEGTTETENPVWVEFAKAMVPLTIMPSAKIAELLNVTQMGECKVLDIAAGHGMFGITLAKANPKVQVTPLDWANVLEVAKANARAAEVESRYHPLPGSAFDADYGEGYDVALITNFLHHFDVPTCEKFLRKVHRALKPGGRAVTVEFVPDENRQSPVNAVAFGLVMLASTPAGDAYTMKELDSMFRNAGFGSSEIHPLDHRFQSIIVTQRP